MEPLKFSFPPPTMFTPVASTQPQQQQQQSGSVPASAAGMVGPHGITKEQLTKYFHLPITEVAKELGVCATMLKKICRKCGIPRWPFRKIKSIDKMIASLELSMQRTPAEAPSVLRELAMLRNKRAHIIRNPEVLARRRALHGVSAAALRNLHSDSDDSFDEDLSCKVQQQVAQQQQLQQRHASATATATATATGDPFFGMAATGPEEPATAATAVVPSHQQQGLSALHALVGDPLASDQRSLPSPPLPQQQQQQQQQHQQLLPPPRVLSAQRSLPSVGDLVGKAGTLPKFSFPPLACLGANVLPRVSPPQPSSEASSPNTLPPLSFGPF